MDTLTPRQLQMLRLRCEGRSGPEIADRLFVSPHTVRNTLRKAYAAIDPNGGDGGGYGESHAVERAARVCYLLGRADEAQRAEGV